MKAQRKEKPIKKAAMRPILNNIIGMFFLLFLTIGGAVYVQTTRQVKSQALETAQWVADKMNAAVGVQLQSVETQAQSIAAQVKAALAEGGQGADLVPIIDTLTAHLERSAELSSVAFVARAPLFSNRRVSLSPDSAGRFSFVIRKSGQSRTDFQAVGVNAYNNQVWWHSGLKANAPLSCAEHFISDDFGSKKQVKEIACPILHQGEAVGVLAFTLNLEQLGADAAGVASKNADVRVFAAAPNGTLFASANPAFVGQPYDSCFSGKLARNLTSLKTNGQPFSLKASADGRRGFWVAIPLPTEAGNGFIALSLPILTLFHAPIVVCLILFILIIMEFISIFLITNFFLTLISKLLAVLSRNALAIASGDNGAITDLSSVSRLKTAETAQLQQAFAQMLTNIQLKQKQILWLAEQDLSHEMEAASKEDSLGHSIQSLHAKLSAFFGELKTATNQVKTGTQQIADSAQNLSQATTEQASAVEEISASLLEISVQSKDNTTKTNETNQTMQQVTAAAHKGCDKMQTLLQVAQEISEASKQTETIVKAIDDIAFQTNLLALNANVEAARAGKYGRGFGVVAEEVRSLAKKSADSVIQTQAIITSMIDKINKSNQFIEETHDALNEILDFSDSVAKDMEAIKYANNEQNVGIEQITKAISQIEQVTQSNSAIAEEAAAATEELSAQAVEIEKTLTRIKMKPSDTPLAPLQPQPVPVRTQPMPEVKSTAPSAASVIKLDDDDFGNF